ncbi:hypothetical protein PHLGIDRAFT_58459, partial [Phlebiopsis gigantea 11061_1 CR5-6]
VNPRLYRGFLWSEDTFALVTPSATLSETLRPLPRPPESERSNRAALRTIALHPELFKVETPVNVDLFEAALRDHPNRALVESVLLGLREGFWPIWDERYGKEPDEAERAYVEAYAQEEEACGRYSPEFGPELLPGMYSMPVYAIPKPGTDKLRLINDHSAGKHALNDAIDRNDVGMRQDNVQDLGTNLLYHRGELGDVPLWLFKSDVSNAYRLLPMHPLWQIRQVVSVGDRRRVDWRCCFGSRGSPDLWCTFMSLVLWIGKHVAGIPGLLAYMDDTFAVDPNPGLFWYEPYRTSFPAYQVRLLRLWDDLGIPHRQNKQLFGRQLTIIGFHVDSDAMTVSLPPATITELTAAIREFVLGPQQRHALKKWQQLLGWINWGLNVRPLARPGLQSSYDKMRGKNFPRAGVWINNDVRRDLLWVASLFESGAPVHFLSARSWAWDRADLLVWCDASLSGMGFWCPRMNVGFAAPKPPAPSSVEDNIFWYEALTVAAAIAWAASLRRPPQRLAVFTDNLNSVQMFTSFKALPVYNDILRFVAGIMTSQHIDVRVWHVPGVDNPVADSLSR